MKLEDAAIPREYFEQLEKSMTDERRQELEAARERAQKRLAQPDMQPDAIRARIEAAAKWEEEHGEITVFCGERLDEGTN